MSNTVADLHFRTGNVLGARVAAVSREQAAELVVERALSRQGGYVCAAPVHSIMEGFDAASFRKILNEAFMVVPDGLPVAVALRLQGFARQPRVAGPDLMKDVCVLGAQRGLRFGFYGSSDECLGLLEEKLPKVASSIQIHYSYSPPFRKLSLAEKSEIIQDINAADIDVLFVGLGCPRQEIWMHDHANQLTALQIGVGAAFDFHAGLLGRAPEWMQQSGLEWTYRLLKEPRRLWRRYFRHNPRFVLNTLLQRSGIRKFAND